ncbi:hypothetical protein JYT91_00215 [archaeon AH-315-M20]|nr:hypothetical protein [archaeon AH-315-M20]
MQKRYLIFSVILIIFIYGCAQTTIDEGKTVDERLKEGGYEDTTTDHLVPNDYKYLEENLDVLLDAGNIIGARHYDELDAAARFLELQGVDISKLKIKLAKLNVATRQGEEETQEEFVTEEPQEDFGHIEAKTTETEQTEVKIRRKNSEIPTDEERDTLPDCENKFFTTTPVDLSDVGEITPIGNLGPPGHTFPTDHSYLHLGKYGENKAYPLFAPADVHITSVSWNKGSTQDPIDYTIYFALCKDVIGYYNHVKATSSELNKLTDKVKCERYTTQAENSCTKILLEKVEEGTLLGEVGLKQGNFDFGLIDLRKELNFVNPVRHPTRTRFINCPYDYYKKDLQKQFFDLIKRDDAQQCGITMQDVPGTLKGTWFHETSPKEYVVDWDVYLAFVNDNDFPDVQVVSIAGIFTDPSKFKFIPKTSGKIDREFSQVTTDGNIYCYQAKDVGKSFEPIPTGKILVQLISDTQLKIEHQSGSCTGSFSFNNPTIYNR